MSVLCRTRTLLCIWASLIFFGLFTFLFILEEIVSRTRALLIQVFFCGIESQGFYSFIFLVFYLFNPLILTRTLAILWDRISFSLILFTFLFTLKNQYSLGPGPFCAPEPQGLFKLVWFVLILKYKIYLGPRPFCGIESQGFFFLFLIFYLFNPLLWNWTSRFFYNLFTFLFIFKNQYFLGPGPFCQPEPQGFFKLVWF